MPLRDHFHPPLNETHRWQSVHALWPGLMLAQLFPYLPEGYRVEPEIQLGRDANLDMGALEVTFGSRTVQEPAASRHGASQTYAPPLPHQSYIATWEEEDLFELRVYNHAKERRLVAAVELISLSNKDRPESRKHLVEKCVALLKADVNVVIVDVVTSSFFNIYVEILDSLNIAIDEDRDPSYCIAASMLLRDRRENVGDLLSWPYELHVGNSLPTLPLWLDAQTALPLNLEVSYEEACRLLFIS